MQLECIVALHVCAPERLMDFHLKQEHGSLCTRYQICCRIIYDMWCSVSVSVANNALRAHHASAHGGVSTNGLADICLIFLN